jgi:hypothetical protein
VLIMHHQRQQVVDPVTSVVLPSMVRTVLFCPCLNVIFRRLNTERLATVIAQTLESFSPIE